MRWKIWKRRAPPKPRWFDGLFRRKSVARYLKLHRKLSTAPEYKSNHYLSHYAGMFGMEPPKLIELMDDIAGKNGQARVLDIGSGQGGFLKVLKKVQGDRVHVEGITLKAPRKRVGIDKLHVKMAEEVVFPRNKRFDCIFAVNILQHASSPMYVMQKMFNNLKPGGLGFIAITGMNPEVMVALSMWAQSKAIKVIAAGERDDFHSIIFQRTTNADFELLQLRL